jgi:hypothetical protein
MLRGRVLRSKDPVGIEQELWALLTLYQALRMVMVTAAESMPGTDPDRAAFATALEAARDTVITASGVLPASVDLVGQIGAAVLANLLPARRLRFSARKVKSPISRYHAHTDTARPLASTTITAVEVTIRQPAPSPPRQTPAIAPKRRARTAKPSTRPAALPPTHTSPARPSGRRHGVLAVLRSTPGRSWRARDIAQILGDTSNLNSFCVQMSQWAHRGLTHKTGPPPT